MKNVMLKSVAEEDWVLFRSEALTHNMKNAEFLSYLIKEHTEKTHKTDRLNRILSYRSGRSEGQLKKHEEFIDRFRKQFTLKR